MCHFGGSHENQVSCDSIMLSCWYTSLSFMICSLLVFGSFISIIFSLCTRFSQIWFSEHQRVMCYFHCLYKHVYQHYSWDQLFLLQQTWIEHGTLAL
jgi:hypothetical protein